MFAPSLRNVRIAVLCLALFAPFPPSGSSAQMVETGEAAPPFLLDDVPLEPGDLWRYGTTEMPPAESGEEPRAGVLEVRVLARHRHGPITVTALARRRSGPEASEDITFVASADTAAWVIADPRRLRAVFAGDPQALDPERADLRFPLEPGRRWGVLESEDRPDNRYVTDVGAPETVVVPAGTFSCLPVRFSTLPDQSTSWFAPGIGLVQYEYRHHGTQSGETWRLIEFEHGAVDTAAIGRAIDGAFDRLLAQPGFWSRRGSAVWDPTLRALLGPLTGGDGPDLDEGIRRFYIRGAASGLTVEQLSNVPSWAYLVRWRSGRRVLHVFAREWEPLSGGGILGGESAPPLFPDLPATTPDGRALQKARADFVRARRLVEGGDPRRAGAAADSAMTAAAGVLADVLDAAPPDLPASRLKTSVREALGDAFLTTHYGTRVRVDDGFVRYRMERGADWTGVWCYLVGEGGTMYGPAPRIRSSTGDRTWSLAAGPVSMEPRKILDLDWSKESPEADVLVWSAGLPPASVPSITLFRPEEDGVRAVWRRDVPEGQARLIQDRARLELTYLKPDSLNGVFRTLWREEYGPPEAGSEVPVPIRRRILNPWVATAARVVNAFRGGRPDFAVPVVRGSDLLTRIAASWLADPRVAISASEADPVSIDRLEEERVASVTMRRAAPRLPENPGPGLLSFRLTPDASGNWVVVDLVALPGADPLGP